MKLSVRRLLAAFCIASLAIGVSAAAQLASTVGATVTTPHVRAELIASAPQGVTPGAQVWVGLKLDHQPEWHTYWKNAGDSGLPTELAWSLPAGVSSGEIEWPVPRKIPIGNLANYGYEDTVLLPVPLTVSPEFKPVTPLTGIATLDVRLKASWLVCRLECIPEDGEFLLKLPVTGSTVGHQEAFDSALAARPVELQQAGAIAVEGQTLRVRLDGLPASAKGKSLELFPETGEVIHTAAVLGKDWTQAWLGDTWTATVPLADQRSASPAVMPLVVALTASDRVVGQPIAWRAEARVSGDWPSSAPRAQISPALQASLDANTRAPIAPTPSPTIAAALLGALLGGLLLNLMPCVFPVLAIKILSFTRRADDRHGHRTAAVAYTAGVVLSLLALGAAMLGLRAAGAQLG